MANLENVVRRLEAVATKLESVSRGSGTAKTEGTSEIVDAYDEIISKHLAKLQQLTEAIGSSELKQQMKIVGDGFKHQRDFLVVVSQCGTPKQDDLSKLLKPTADCLAAVQDVREKNRTSKQFNHLSCISDWISVLGWVTTQTKPHRFIKETATGADFYGNRVIKDFKGKDENHVEWVKAVKPISVALEEYAQQYHANGLAWNINKPPATSSSIPAQAAPGGPPPPPPAVVAPPPPAVGAPAPTAGGGAKDMSALFSDLNKGAGVTKGLKKVDPSMQTHKNPALRAGATVPAKKTTASSAPKPAAAASKASAPKAPVLERVGKKWMVENHEGNADIKISDCSMKETVYVYKCNNCVIQVTSKINTITLDSCKKTGVVFGDVLSTVDFVNCQSIKAQADGHVPTISVDKTDGCQLYLNDKSSNVDIVTAKSSEMNVLIRKEDGDCTEYPIPEQFKTKFTGKGLKTEALDIVA